jgi:hypothetical protein
MMSPALIVGVDPGPIPGIVVLALTAEHRITPSTFQCDAGSVLWLVRESLSSAHPWDRRILAIERFVVGPRAARSSTPKAGQVTRDMVGALTAFGLQLPGVQVVQRCASEVMPWAVDARLDRAGLLDLTTGMPHARAAARHALFATVNAGLMPDPLSRNRSSASRPCCPTGA